MPRSSSAANPHEDVFLTIVFQSHLGHPSVDTAIGSFPAGFAEPITGPAIADVAVRNRSRRVIFKSYLKLRGVRGRAGAEDKLTSISGPSRNPRQSRARGYRNPKERAPLDCVLGGMRGQASRNFVLV